MPVGGGCPTVTTGIPSRSTAAPRGSRSVTGTALIGPMTAYAISLDESARLDGVNAFTIHRKIDFSVRFPFGSSEDLGVISTSLFRFKRPYAAHRDVILTTLIVFLSLRRFVYDGFARGATG